MIYLKQTDPRWASITLGKSRSSLAAYGCTTTDISMLLDYFKCYIEPGKLAKLLDYTADGSLLWNSVTEKTGMKFLWRYYSYVDKDAVDASKNPFQAVLLRTRVKLQNGTYSHHWVVGIRKVPFTKQTWVIVDPLTGTLTTTLKYGNYIDGMATFCKK